MSSGLAPEDVLLRQAARGQPDLFPTLVEETFPRAWALLGGSREGLLFVYGSMRDHLEEVDSRTRFWDWFLQITYVSQAKFRTLSEAEIAKVPPDAVPDFLELLSLEPRSPSRDLLTRLTRLHLSGWLAAFGSSTLWTLMLVFRDAEPRFDNYSDLALVPCTALLAASITSLLVGPWMSRRWAFLSLLVLFPLSVGASLFVFSALGEFANGSFNLERTAFTSLGLLTGLDLVPALIGAASFMAFGILLTRMRSWVNSRSRSLWRRLVSLLLTASMLGWAGFQIGPTIVRGWKLDPEILAAGPQPDRSLSELEPSIYEKTRLPESYTKHPAIVRLQNFTNRGDSKSFPSFRELELARTVWLDHVHRAWPERGQSTRRVLLQHYVGWPESETLPLGEASPQQAEVAFRMALISPYLRAQELLNVLDSPHRSWKEMADVAASVEWARPGAQVDERVFWWNFKSRAESLKERYDELLTLTAPLGQALLEGYQIVKSQSELNRSAKEFRKFSSLLHTRRPWPPNLVEKVLEFCWSARATPSLRGLIVEEEHRRRIAELALRLELKNLQSQGKPQPKTSSELRPPFNEIAETYVEWFSLDKLWNELLSAK